MIITVTVITVGGGVVLAGYDGTAGGTSVVSSANKQDRAAIVQNAKRLLAVGDEATLDAALSRIVADGRLIEGQATRIRGALGKKQDRADLVPESKYR